MQAYAASNGTYLVHTDPQATAAASAAAAGRGLLSAAGGRSIPSSPRVPAASPSASAGRNGEHSEWLPRVKICFLAEEPALYAKRYVAAHAARAEALALLQYELYADCMPMDDVPQMAAEQLQRVLQSALNSKKLRDQLLDASSLVAAANM